MISQPVVERKRVLLTVKAYPQPSRSYDELVCTAGVLEDGSWIRIYPVPFQFLISSKIKKYDWIDLDLKRNDKDFRPESFHPKSPSLADIEKVGHIDTRRSWEERKRFCCKNVYHSKRRLVEDAYGRDVVSLATFKPARILDFIIEQDDRDWKPEWTEQLKQLDLFTQRPGEEAKPRIPIQKLPYKFKYRFADADGVESTLMIEDWEIGALYWNCLRDAEGDEEVALEKVRQRFWDDFRVKDLHLYLGTTLRYHRMNAPNPFVVVGVFYPPVELQQSLCL